jgi:pyruvate formate lyase activating enzyme
MHFTAFHPDWKMQSTPRTPHQTLSRARRIARDNGVRFPFTGNVHDAAGASTFCPECGDLLIERDWYRLGRWQMDAAGCCGGCGTRIPGRFEAAPERFGAERIPVVLDRR